MALGGVVALTMSKKHWLASMVLSSSYTWSWWPGDTAGVTTSKGHAPVPRVPRVPAPAHPELQQVQEGVVERCQHPHDVPFVPVHRPQVLLQGDTGTEAWVAPRGTPGWR